MTDDTPATPKRSRRRTAPPATDPAAMSATPASDTADVLVVERGNVGGATAGSIEVHLGGIGAATAEDVFVQGGGIGAARADKVSVEFGGIGAALGGELRVTQGAAGSVIARDATLEQSLVRTVVAARVTVLRPSAVLVLIAQRVEGDVRTLLDWRGALAFGVGFGLAAGLVRAVREGAARRH